MFSSKSARVGAVLLLSAGLPRRQAPPAAIVVSPSTV